MGMCCHDHRHLLDLGRPDHESRRPTRELDDTPGYDTWPTPTSAEHVRSFLGLATYFRKFCRHFATKAHALHQTLKKPKPGQKTGFFWGPEQETAFRKIKRSLTRAPTLSPPNMAKGAPPFHIVCDASGVGLGGILMQDGHPVAYESRKMLPAERNYGVGEQELLAVVHAMRTWRCYLEGVKSVVVTDHNPNTYLQTQPMLTRRQVRWSEYLQNFDFDWLYKPGPQNPADPLSRMPQFSATLLLLARSGSPGVRRKVVLHHALTCKHHVPSKAGVMLRNSTEDRQKCQGENLLMAIPHFQHPRQYHDPANLHLFLIRRSERIRAAAMPTKTVTPSAPPAKRPRPTRENPLVRFREDPESVEELVEGTGDEPRPVLREENLAELCRLGYDLDPWFKDKKNLEGLTLEEGLYRADGKVVVPNVGTLRLDILEEEHDTPFGGHQGVARTYEKVNRAFWWPTLRAEVTHHVGSCSACQRSKVSHQAPAGMLQPLDVPQRRWGDVSMDFITALPLSARGNTQIVVFVDRLTKMVHLDALPEKATATEVARCFMRNIFRLHGMPERLVSDRDAKFISHFWSEVMRMMGTKRRMSTAYHPQTDGQTERYNQTLEDMLRHWVNPHQDNWDVLLDAAEFATNNSVCTSTKDTPFRLNYGQDPLTPLSVELDTRIPAARDFVAEMTQSLANAKVALAAAQSRHKYFYDQGRRHLEMRVGARVLLRSTNLKFKAKVSRKLMPKWIGPFEVTERVGELAYRLKLPPTLRIHNVFHVELLKEFKDSDRHQPPPLPVEVDGEIEYEVEAVTHHRYVKRGKRPPASEYLVKWAGYGAEFNSWEPEAHVEETVALTEFIAKQLSKGRWPPPVTPSGLAA